MITVMKNLLTISGQDFNPDSPKVDISNFTERGAARAALSIKRGEKIIMQA